MKLVKMECEHCGATLEIDMDHMEAYCPYCGSKLMVDVEHLEDIVESTQQTKRVQIKEEEQTKRTEMEYAYKNKVNKQSQFVLKGFMILMGSAFAMILGFALIDLIRFTFFM